MFKYIFNTEQISHTQLKQDNMKLLNTKIISNINEISKQREIPLNTNVYVRNITNPIYEIDNEKFSIKIDNKNNGFFAYGSNFDKEIEEVANKDGFHLFISLKKLKFENIYINNELKKQNFSNLKSILLSVEEFDFFSEEKLDDFLKLNQQTLPSIESNLQENFY